MDVIEIAPTMENTSSSDGKVECICHHQFSCHGYNRSQVRESILNKDQAAVLPDISDVLNLPSSSYLPSMAIIADPLIVEEIQRPVVDSNELLMMETNERRNRISLKDVQVMFRPFHIVEAIFVLSRYQMKDNLVVQNSFLYNMLSGTFIALLTACIIIVNLKSSISDVSEGMGFVKFFCDVQEVLLLSLGNIMCFVTNVIKAPSNVLLPSITQNLCKIICQHEQAHFLNKFVFINWLFVCFSIVNQALWILIFKYGFYCIFDVDQVLTYSVYILYDVNVMYGARTLKLMLKAFEMWIDDARKSERLLDAEKDAYWNNLFGVYMDIFEAYKTVADAFNPSILYYYIKTLDNTVFAIYLRIEIGKTVEGSFIQLLVTILASLCWLYKDIFMMIVFSVMCEKFYSATREVKSVCIRLIASPKCSDTQKKHCKNIIRHLEVSFEKINACRLFVVDAALVLHYAGLLTTYVLVVFQFEFL